MKGWIKIILGTLPLIPVTIVASEDGETQEACEHRTVAATYKLMTAMNEGGIFAWEDYVSVASKMLEASLERYPESMELNERLQDLTFDRMRDQNINKEKRQSLMDSLVSHYKQLYVENPKSVLSIYLYSRIIYNGVENLQLAKEMLKADKNSYWANEAMGWSYERLGQQDSAEMYYKKAIEIDSTVSDAYSGLAGLYFEDMRYKEAFPIALRAYRLASHPNRGAAVYSIAKKSAIELHDKAFDLEIEEAAFERISSEEELSSYNLYRSLKEITRDFRALEEPDSVSLYLAFSEACVEHLEQSWPKADLLYDEACFQAWQGNKEKALDLLEMASKQGFNKYNYIESNPDLALLQDDPRYIALVKPMKEAAKESALSNRVDKPAPDFTLVSTEGDTVTLSKLKGNIVVLVFWPAGSYTLGAYVMNIFDKYNDEHPGKVLILGMACFESNIDKIEYEMRNLWNIKLPNLICTDEVIKAYGIPCYPHFCVIDKEGNRSFDACQVDWNEDAYTKFNHDRLDWWLEELNKTD